MQENNVIKFDLLEKKKISICKLIDQNIMELINTRDSIREIDLSINELDSIEDLLSEACTMFPFIYYAFIDEDD